MTIEATTIAQTFMDLINQLWESFSLQGYFRKAEACKQLALMDSEKRASYCQSAIGAYLNAFELSQHTDDDIDKTLCRAIVFAVDYGKYTLIVCVCSD